MFLAVAISLFVSVAIVIAIALVARSRWGTPGVCAVAATSFVFSCFLFSAALSLQSLLTFVFAFVCLFLRLKPRIVVATAITALLVSYGTVFGVGYFRVRERAQLREEYPLVSVAERLAYETRTKVGASKDTSLALAPELEKRLVDFEVRGHSNTRVYMLSSLHNRTRDQFELARGFGETRMLSVRPERLRLPNARPVPLPEAPYDIPSESALPLANVDAPSADRLAKDDLLAMHGSGLEDVFEPERMGYVRDRDHVAGFQSHRFTKLPRPEQGSPLQTSWHVSRLELVSLLRQETPAVYVSTNLPRMDELQTVPTRSLTVLELAALARLRSEEDLVIEDTGSRIRMVGSIRAAKDCLACHKAQRGELLGAFTYELTPDHVPPIKPKSEPLEKPQAARQRPALNYRLAEYSLAALPEP